MKKLLLLAIFMAAGFSNNISAYNSVPTKKATRCFMFVRDKNGVIIGQVQVKCPDIIVT